MTDYTPDADEVEARYIAAAATFVDFGDAKAEFDRWLAKHDADVTEKTLRDLLTSLKASPIVTLAGNGGAYEFIERQLALPPKEETTP